MRKQHVCGGLLPVKMASATITAGNHQTIGPIDNSQLCRTTAHVTLKSSIPEGASGNLTLNLIHETPLGWAAECKTFGTISASTENEGDFCITFSTPIRKNRFYVLVTNGLDASIDADIVVELSSMEIRE